MKNENEKGGIMRKKIVTRKQEAPPPILAQDSILQDSELVRVRTRELAEIQATVFLAKQFPRDEEEAREKIMKALERPRFAQESFYSYPRGNGRVEGPSVWFAREGARNWKNIRYGLNIVREDEESITIEGWAWDVEGNTKVTAQDEFKKLIYRKNLGWIKPDERDLRELINRRGAILVRNCILQNLPKDLVDDAMAKAKETLKKSIRQPEKKETAIEKIISSFQQLGISKQTLERIIGQPIDTRLQEDKIVELRGIYSAVKDGQAKITDFLPQEEGDEPSLDLQVEK